jgi:hypothetical protein
MIGRRPCVAFGNSTGDRQMLEYAKAGAGGAGLSMIVLHDDAEREYAYGPAQGLPNTMVGTLTQALYDEAKKDGWFVISMKNDWKHISPLRTDLIYAPSLAKQTGLNSRGGSVGWFHPWRLPDQGVNRCSGKYLDGNFPFHPLLDRVSVRGHFTSSTAQTLPLRELFL